MKPVEEEREEQTNKQRGKEGDGKDRAKDGQMGGPLSSLPPLRTINQPTITPAQVRAIHDICGIP